MIWTGLHLFAIAAALVSIGLGAMVVRYREFSGTIPMIVMLLSVGQWSLGAYFELAADGVAAKLFWDNVQFLGYSLLIPAVLLFVRAYSGRSVSKPRYLIPLLALEPVATNVLAWTSGAHTLIRDNPRIEVLESFTLLSYDWGPWLWISTLYALVLYTAALVMLARHMFRRSRGRVRQPWAVLVGLIIPWVGGILLFAGLIPDNVDLSPLFFTVGFAVLAWGVFREELFPVSTATYRSIVENALHGIILLDSQQRVVRTNPAARELLGVGETGAVGKQFLELFGLEIPIKPRDEHGRRWEREVSVITPKARGYYHLRGKAVRLSGRGGIGTLVFFDDVTREKEAERELRTLGLAIENAQVSVVITDAEATITYVNPFFERLTGYSKREAVGQNPKILRSGYHDDVHYEQMWATLTGGRPWHGELRNRKKDGSLYWEQAALSPIADEDGTIIQYVGVKEDITDRKELDTLREEVDRITRHDIRSPLNAVIALPELMLKDPGLTAEQREDLALIAHSGRNVLEVMNLSVTLLNIESGRYDYKPEPLDLAVLVKQWAREQKAAAAVKGVTTTITARGFDSPEVDHVMVLGDRLLAYSVISNLLKNAVEASPEDETVTVEFVHGTPIVVRIHNQGAVPADMGVRTKTWTTI